MIRHILQSLVIAVVMVWGISAMAQENAPDEKLYNFDEMLIDGAFRDPQGMFERARADAEFEGVLKLERSFVTKSEETSQEASMRP